ncbi:hypothetical protein JCM10908_007362 [Rhodotorula pacifica]|uniref:nucleoside deaminase n=1 Tax=Rhodotorula pacifica TaxID=1495444 RepID=UPI00317E02EA
MSLIKLAALALCGACSVVASHYPGLGLHNDNQAGLSLNGVPAATRTKWMRVANDAVPEILSAPCSHFPFGVAVVNTTSDELVCVAANKVGVTGNPSMHGEISGLHRCTEVLTERGLSPQEILAAWRDFTMYTTGEPCPMCASALRWAGMGEVVWATSIETIIKGGRNQIYLPSSLIVSASYSLPHQTHWFGSVLANETDPHFFHQFNESAACPDACTRQHVEGSRVSMCLPDEQWKRDWKAREGEWERQLMETKGAIAEEWYGVTGTGKKVRTRHHDEL